MTVKNIVYMICVVCASLVLHSCDDFLDSFPQGEVTDENFWKSEEDAEKILVDIYNATMPKGGIFFDEAMSDNAYLRHDWWVGSQQVANGSLNASSTVPNSKWKSCYESIRKCWFLLEGIPRVTFKSEQGKNALLGQAYFMLAYNYYLLTSYYGDVPLVVETLSIPESKALPRTKKSEVVEYAIKKLEEAVLLLENISLEYGRVTADACRCLMARIYLYNADYANVLKVIQPLEGKYQLYTEGETPYADLFSGVAEQNCEVILGVPCDKKVGSVKNSHNGNLSMLLKGMTGGDPYCGIAPSGSLVDAYPMADGRLIHEAGSVYNPSKPYESRDPRFYQSIVYPTGQQRYLDVKTKTIKVKLYDPEDPTTTALQQYNAPEPSATGYIWNKYIDFSVYGMTNISDCTNDIIVFRYADILLMKAEALVRTKGEEARQEVCNLIDQLRDRVRGGRVHRENYQSADKLMELVKNERRIELANEGIRYFDIIRWKEAECNTLERGIGLTGEMYGAYMRKDGVGKDDRTITVDGVERRYVETRYFDPSKGYLFPVPQSERDLNPNLTQNPNW